MSVHVSSVFVLSCLGSGLATGLIPRPGSLPAVLINSDGKEEEEEEDGGGMCTSDGL
jgi:hypothetical protein